MKKLKKDFIRVERLSDITGEGSPRKTKHDLLYKCLIKCAFSGRMLSGETKKGSNNSGEYIYYRCTHKEGCKQPCKPLKAGFVDEFVEDTIKKLIPTQEQIEFLVNRIKEIHKSKNQYDENAIETIQKEILTLKKRINNAYNDKLDGLISHEFYFEKEKAWQREIDEKEVRLKNVMTSDSAFISKAEHLLELCKNAYNWYYRQDCENKRSFLKLICSNFFYDGSNLTMATKNTFKTMLESDIFVNGGRLHTI